MVGTLITIHGLIRWVLVAIAIALIVRFAIGWLGRGSFTSLDRKLGSAFAIAMTIQFALGLVNLIGLASIGAFRPAVHFEHAFYGLVATAASHLAVASKNRPDVIRFRNGLLLTGGVLVLVLLSVTRLRGSFFFGMV